MRPRSCLSISGTGAHLRAQPRARCRVRLNHLGYCLRHWPAFLPATQSAGYTLAMAAPSRARRRPAPASAQRDRGLPEEALAMFRAWGRQGGEARKRALSEAERSAQPRQAVTAR